MANENTKIFSEAIAEAKAIRETAMVNAKLALEEAFAPRMQEMMSSRLEALAEEDEDLEERFTGKNGEMTSNDGDNAANLDEISLEELLAELEGLEENELEEEHSYSEKEGSVDPGVNDPYMEENEIFEAEDDDKATEITVADLKDLIRDALTDVLGNSGEEEAGEEEEMAGEEEEEAGEEEEMDGDKELTLEEILAELEEDMDTEEAENAISMIPESSKELEEAMSTIAQLRSELNEVNLLNSKLLYVNKLFKSKNLTEAQKVKVINAFDRAETVKESKNIYETLQESLTTSTTSNTKSQIKESLSFASKPAGVADRKPIVENNDFVARMQKLAGII